MKNYHKPGYESCHSSDSENDNIVLSRASSSSQSIDERSLNEHKDPVKKRKRRKSSHRQKSHNNIVFESKRHDVSLEHSSPNSSTSTNSSSTHAEQQQETTLLQNHLKTYYQGRVGSRLRCSLSSRPPSIPCMKFSLTRLCCYSSSVSLHIQS